MAVQLATSEVNVTFDDGDSVVECIHGFCSPWKNIVRMVNAHNERYVKQETDTVMRVWCPWTGEELHVPRQMN